MIIFQYQIILLIDLQMFSLSDDISKFEKQTFTLKDDTITIDQRFLGGGINMKDLIQENNFIITEMRKMKTVFLNYCKLNEKVYKTIMEHQISAADQLSKMNNLTSTMQRKLQTTTKQFKKLKQQIIHESHKNKQFVQVIVQNLKVEVGEKVDEKSFAEKVKFLIDQYENEDSSSKVSSSPYMSAAENQQKGSQAPRPKKKRGLTAEDIELLKSQLIPLIEGVNEKVDQNEKTMIEKGNKIQILQKASKKYNEEISWSKQDIKKIDISLEKVEKQRKDEDNKILQELRQSINQKIWDMKFQEFNANNVQKPIQKLQQNIEIKYEVLRKQISDIDPQIKDIYQQIGKKTTQIKEVDSKFIKVNENFENIQKEQQSMKKQYTRMIQENKNKIETIKNQLHSKSQQSNHTLTTKILQLAQQIENLAKYIEQTVLKRVDSKMGIQMKQIRNDIFSLHEKTKDLKYSLISNGQQVTHVKDVVAKKANFTDLLHFIEKKADKKDFKQIQDYLSSPKTQRQQTFETKDAQTFQTKRKATSYSKMRTPGTSKPQQYSAKNLLNYDGIESKQLHRSKLKGKKEKKGRPTTANTMFLL